ncbi:Receptor-like serine/threonine-protein kinase [Heracleum sosnowskyi]|uniref:Receptor-like serine/threonine-protein kinase n=1 Tax=Heracleum sosnowskyi TaxID=360622 RepID=A0AAD8HE53_9APIA|nr:Receptor-like serine/threonine-protein kinase [Heracleum sosnowskyi]
MLCENISRRFLFIFFLLGACTSTSIITPDKPLSDGHANVVSAGESFVLGYFSPDNSSRRYVGIWYNKVPVQTVVWVANRDNPITNTSGVLSLDKTGNLVLFDSQKPDVVVWSSNVSNLSSVVKSNYSAELLDTGNLVVREGDGKNKGFAWQSFDFPTDTLLPEMKFGVDRRSGLNRFLTSWKSPDNPESGSYSYMIDINGSVPQLFLYKNKDPFWRGGSWNGLRWTGVPELRTNFIFKVSYVDNPEEVSIEYGMLNSSIISRMVLNESTGTIQRSTWHQGDNRWDNFWSAPQDRCDHFSNCGAFGDCNLDNAGEYECSCLPGFEPKSSRDWYLRDGSQGCVPKQKGQLCGNGEGFVKLVDVKLPDATKTRLNMSLDNKACADLCLRNCSCTGYSGADVRGGGFSGCITWYDKLVDLREYSRGGQDFYIRVDAVELAKNSKKSKIFHGYIKVLVLVLVCAAFFVLFTLAYWIVMKRKKASRRKEGIGFFQNDRNKLGVSVHGSSTGEEGDEIETSTVDVKFYSLGTIVEATENFSLAHKVGEGGFGSVYKGKLRNGQEIAVKRLSNTSGQGIEEFRNEVTLIAKLQHRNLVRLFGYCIQREEKMLVYEYLPNKGLDCFIFDKEKKDILDWKKRFDIALGIARGMVYLHHDSRLRIIHRDLKASNVLLDAHLNPKIADFGMARIFGNDQIDERTKRVVGTYGYMSPEYAMEGLFSIKSDVFSFGVLLLEIITGRKNSSYQSENSINMIGHVWDLWGESNVLEIVDPALGKSHEFDTEILRCIHIALLCVQESATARPSMSEVVFMLSNEISLRPPGQAAFLLRTANKNLTNTSSGSTVGAISVNDFTISTVEGR